MRVLFSNGKTSFTECHRHITVKPALVSCMEGRWEMMVGLPAGLTSQEERGHQMPTRSKDQRAREGGETAGRSSSHSCMHSVRSTGPGQSPQSPRDSLSSGLRLTLDKGTKPYVPRISEQVTQPLLAPGACKSAWSWAQGQLHLSWSRACAPHCSGQIQTPQYNVSGLYLPSSSIFPRSSVFIYTRHPISLPPDLCMAVPSTSDIPPALLLYVADPCSSYSSQLRSLCFQKCP